MNRVFKTLTLSLVVLLSACQSAPPVPQDKYYRLTVTPGPTWTQPLLRDAVFVAPLRAEGLYAERAMLYASVQRPRELLQYHYQFWSEPPALLLQEHLRASLGASHLAAQVTDVASLNCVLCYKKQSHLRPFGSAITSLRNCSSMAVKMRMSLRLNWPCSVFMASWVRTSKPFIEFLCCFYLKRPSSWIQA